MESNIEVEAYFEDKAMKLLNQLEHILERDPLIDEVGFIHPSQFIKLNEEAICSQLSSVGKVPQSADGMLSFEQSNVEVLKQESMVFWNRDHKLGISTQVLYPLYKAAKNAFVAAVGQYKTYSKISTNGDKYGDEDTLCSLSSSQIILENEVMKHSKALLLLSCDFGMAWNSRKLVLSRKQVLTLFMNELLLSALVLSYSPKSDGAWSHRRWVFKMITGKCSNLQEIVEKESELVGKIAEKSKMNYRAWSHRCWLVSYMTEAQVVHELKKSRNWCGLHVADNCCFHYRRRLLLKILEEFCHRQDLSASSGYSCDIYQVWKEELDWDEMLIKRFIGREALWLHRRFLSLCWIKHLAADPSLASHPSEERTSLNYDTSNFMDNELQLLLFCSNVPDTDFEDFQAQAVFSATYILWLTKQISDSEGTVLQKKLKLLNLKSLLNKACPEKTLLWNSLIGLHLTVG